jgi:PAS domain S-box-containing protein
VGGVRGVETTEFERFLELSVDMLCVLGYDGYYKRVNEAFERTLGFTEDELLDRPFVDFVHPDDREASRSDLDSLESGRRTGVHEERHLHKDGSYRWLHWTAVPAGDDETCYALARDVTERKLAEAELASSRARIVEAGDAARRTIERDLHDGAQQRLVGLSLHLRLLERELDEPAQARRRLEEAQREVAQSLAELRDLARGIHPAVLTSHGLAVALQQVATYAPVPVELVVDLDDRPAERVEVAAYYLVSEALANVAKHASAETVTVSLRRTGDDLLVEIADDGIGGADAHGSGLRGLADRVEAVGGTLNVVSPPGEGTSLSAELPCG